MAHSHKLVLFSLIAAGLGIAGGYLFSSKFCKVTINKRVDKEIALNQALRTLFIQNTIFNHNAARAKLFHTPDQKELQNLVMQNQEEINTLLAAYYGNNSMAPIHELLTQRNDLIQTLLSDKNSSLTQWRDALKQNTQAIADAFALINPDVSDLSLKPYLTQQEALVQEDALGLQHGNYQASNVALLKQLDIAGSVADELNLAITKQFRARF